MIDCIMLAFIKAVAYHFYLILNPSSLVSSFVMMGVFIHESQLGFVIPPYIQTKHVLFLLLLLVVFILIEKFGSELLYRVL